MSENYQPITGFAAADVGPRDVLEDYAVVEDVVTAGGLYLKVGIVCDGVGGIKSGERAAFLTANTTLEMLRNSYDTIVPRMMVEAVREANRRVYNDSTSGKSTIAMYVIHLDGQTPYGRLYIASVGDSNVFLVRQNSLKRLNTDHNVANEMVLNGEATPEQAYALQNAYHITRAIGVGPDVDVDIGFYFNAASREQARQRGKAGIIVEAGDTIFSCSDGLTDAGQDGLPYVREEEFLQHALDLDPQRAAKMYLSYALRRGTHDNVSVALMFVEAEERFASGDEQVSRIVGIRTRYAVLGGLLLLAISAAIIFLVTSSLRGKVSETEQEIRQVTQAAQAARDEQTAMAQTIAAYTPTPTITPSPSPTPSPTPTALPPLAPGEVGYRFTSKDAAPERVHEGEEVRASDQGWIYVSIGDIIAGQRFAYFYFMSNTVGQFLRTTNDEISFFLHKDGEVFIQSKGFERGTEVEVESAPSARFYVRGSCMAIRQREERIMAACYDGTCSFSLTRGGAQESLQRGQQLLFALNDDQLEVVEQTAIDIQDAIRYDNIIKQFSPPDSIIGRSCAGEYVPTPTPTRTPTRRPPTETPTQIRVSDRDNDGVGDGQDNCPDQPGPASNGGCPLPPGAPSTNTPRPPATNTPRPPATNTPPPPATTTSEARPTNTNTPQPTNTPVPPTNTPQPTNTPVPPTNTPQPTNTPVPPTNTPEPPTNTPEPTNTTPPDNDSDGIPNDQDNCPDQPGDVEHNGCPPPPP